MLLRTVIIQQASGAYGPMLDLRVRLFTTPIANDTAAAIGRFAETGKRTVPLTGTKLS